MMGALAVENFYFGKKPVRVHDRKGGPWFVANDICSLLELPNVSQAIARLDEDESDNIILNDVVGRKKEFVIVSESGMWSLVLGSRKKVGRLVKAWLTREVLPALRKTGKYEMPNVGQDGELRPSGFTELETPHQLQRTRVAMAVVRETRENFGTSAARQMWEHLGFPVPEEDLPPARPISNPPVAAPATQRAEATKPVVVPEAGTPEGNVFFWAAASARESRTEATHVKELYANYLRWCGMRGYKQVSATRFKNMVITLFGREEHPEMVTAILFKR